MRNDLQRHKKSDGIKWAFTCIAFLLIAVMLTGVCLQIFGTGKQKPSEWFTKPGTEQTNPEIPDENGETPVIDENGNQLENGVVHEMPAKMTFRTAASLAATASSESAYDSITLNATVKPDSAADKSVDWSIAWVNASSTWATGKTVTNYVTITPQTDGSTTATVQCLEPFGEKVRLTVTSRMNKNVSANCEINFAARPDVIKVNGLLFTGTFDTNSDIVNIQPLVASYDKFSEYSEVSHASLSVQSSLPHTIGEVTINSFDILGKPSYGLGVALRNQNFTVSESYRSLLSAISVPYENTMLIAFFLSCGLDDISDDPVVALNRLNSGIVDNNSLYDIDIRIVAHTDIGDFTYNVKLKVNRSSSVFGVETININNNGIVF